MSDPVTSGRRDYDGKSWLAKNTHHLGVLWGLALMTGIYFVLPLLSKVAPSVPSEAWMFLGAVIGIRQYTSGKADVEANKRVQP